MVKNPGTMKPAKPKRRRIHRKNVKNWELIYQIIKNPDKKPNYRNSHHASALRKNQEYHAF